MKIKISDKLIGENEKVFIIAEIGVNHNNDMDMAKEMIDKAKKAGADAVKFQTFKTENIILKTAPKAEYQIKTTGEEGSWFDLLKTEELSYENHKMLLEYCQQKGIIFLSTPYDEDSADFLEKLKVPAYKIASTDTNNIPFLRHVANTGKPILLSTGMSNLEEVAESVEAIRKTGNEKIILLHCTSNYPAKIEESNLRVLNTLKEIFKVLVGYSDHSQGNTVGLSSIALGATVYERHFTLDRNLPGPDHQASIEPKELAGLINEIRLVEKALGSDDKRPTEGEHETRKKLRKSIVTLKNISINTKITMDMIGIKRPGTGLEPKYFDQVIGKVAKVDIPQETLIKKEDIEW
tara:strand:- start:2573 stop:3622 length:1050 start_codon:yes stop_codon:yes gene_type:complete